MRLAPQRVRPGLDPFSDRLSNGREVGEKLVRSWLASWKLTPLEFLSPSEGVGENLFVGVLENTASGDATS